ncbi:MAG: TlpA disulfide reductase family protein [Pseudomonadota bacterium]
MTAPTSHSDLSGSDTTSMSASRRRMLLGATAATAALLGAGAAWWRQQIPAAAVASPPVDGFWALQWDTPQGGKLSMQSFQGRPLLLNFWATWCAPCVEELPLINDFYRQNKSNGWQVLGLAIDKLAPVQAFLNKMPLDFPVAMAGLTGAELGHELGNVAGGLPFSVTLGSNGAVLQRKMGRLQAADLANLLSLK